MQIVTDEVEIENTRRQNELLKNQIDELIRARQEAARAQPVLNPNTTTNTESKRMWEMLQVLKDDERERIRIEKEQKEAQLATQRAKALEDMKRMEQEKFEKEQEQLCKAAEEEIKKEKEKIQKEKEEKMRQLRKEAEKDTEVVPSLSAARDEKLEQVVNWVGQLQAKQMEQERKQQQLDELQNQLTVMNKLENRRSCTTTGVNIFSSLDTIQEGGAVNLAEKAMATMVAAQNVKRKQEEEGDTDGESGNSTVSKASSNKVKRLKSGLAVKSAHKVKFEVEWAQHNLGKEFEANPIIFNQLRPSHYMMGETEIILRSQNPKEMRARLKLMKKMAYWQIKYDWSSARNVYAAILRGIETGWES